MGGRRGPPDMEGPGMVVQILTRAEADEQLRQPASQPPPPPDAVRGSPKGKGKGKGKSGAADTEKEKKRIHVADEGEVGRRGSGRSEGGGN